jgi:predicted metal-binding protein
MRCMCAVAAGWPGRRFDDAAARRKRAAPILAVMVKKSAPQVMRPSWQALVLVCKSCRKRSSGPKDVKPKALALELRRAAKAARVTTRVALTTCMGLCPKGATTVAVVRRDGTTDVLAVESLAASELIASNIVGKRN